MKNKAQTAMEYLMTYGWAILIIIVVIAALYSLGVFSVRPAVACSPCFSYFAFRDYDAANQIIYLRNGARTLSALSVTAGGTAVEDCNGVVLDCTATPNPCQPGVDVCVTGVDTSTSSQVVTLSYTDADTTVARTDTATIQKR